MTDRVPDAQLQPAATLAAVGLRYGKTVALDAIDLTLPAGKMVGLIGPDGVGKSSLFSLISGARAVQTGSVCVFGGDMADRGHRTQICPRIAYMPQGLGKNLYQTLSVFENLDFFGRLFGQDRQVREKQIAELLDSTGLAPFRDRPAGKLSGGMKQKLGLCCALMHDPDLLLLDEPTTGVDPLSRVQFWELINKIRLGHPGMSVLVATASMEEATQFDWLIAMNAGKILATGTTAELYQKTGATTLEAAFIALLPEEARAGYKPIVVPPRDLASTHDVAIEAKGLTMRFGDFTAVDHVDFRIERGEIFGFLGSNGCGKSTTMKILTGLLPASEGQAWLFGKSVDAADIETRRRIGYMSQGFSLYAELTVRQNLVLHAQLFQVPAEQIEARVAEMAAQFNLATMMDALPESLPLGQRQRLSLAVAMIHKPEVLILDEPTSGVDPIARASFWQIMIDLSRTQHVTIFISTHFMDEAGRCDRISFMHAGRVLVSDTPDAIVKARGVASLEDAFISYLEEATGEVSQAAQPPPTAAAAPTAKSKGPAAKQAAGFSPRRMWSYTRREALELRRDPVRAMMALLGSVILMFVIGYGINLDVANVPFAVLDRDGTTTSQNYTLSLAGSPYFIEKPALTDYAAVDRRMRAGELSVAFELPPGFARDLARGDPVTIGVWVDGSMPSRAETVQSYIQGFHQQWLAAAALARRGSTPSNQHINVETRYRYNPDVKSVVAIAPTVIPILLLLIPAMLTALSVVREKELGSIVNLYVTPVTRAEFIIGKQIPYVALALVNFVTVTAATVFVFGVALKGSLLALTAGAFLYIVCSTAIGLIFSTFMSSQITAIFATAIGTILPATQFSGMINPISSLQGAGAVIARIFPTTYFLTICSGAFSKALGFADLSTPLLVLLLMAPILMAACILLLKKQEG